MEYFFLIAIGVALLEALIQAAWVPLYFRLGLPVYAREVPYKDAPRFELLQETLAKGFGGILAPPVLFRALSPDELAFRESMFYFRLFSYTPIMHGLARLDPVRRVVTVHGYLNWWPLAFLAFWYAFALRNPAWPDFWEQVLWYAAPLVVMAVIYLIQAAVYGKVVRLLREACGGI
jgi:hypothetical protein